MSNQTKAKPTKSNVEYWAKRYEDLERVTMAHENEYLESLDKQFKMANRAIEDQLDKFYRQFASLEDISILEAKRLLNSEELEEFHMSVEEYIKLLDEYDKTLDPAQFRQLRRASLKYRVTRLEAVSLTLMCEAAKVYAGMDEDLYSFLKDVYIDRYYRSVFTIFKGFGIGTSLATLNMDALDRLLHKPWASDGDDFSSRIWFNKQRLINNLQTTLTQSLILGEGYTEACRKMQNRMHTEYNKCARIVVTESAFFSSVAQQQCFNDLEVEEYQIVATLDSVTSEICRDMDGEVFKMSDFQPGETAPPFHPNCRTTCCPYYDDTDVPGYVPMERAARDQETGKTYRVPGDMTYWEWYDKYVENPE